MHNRKGLDRSSLQPLLCWSLRDGVSNNLHDNVPIVKVEADCGTKVVIHLEDPSVTHNHKSATTYDEIEVKLSKSQPEAPYAQALEHL